MPSFLSGVTTRSMELDWLKKWNLYSPSNTALKDGESGRELSYSALYTQVCKMAGYLKTKHTISSGDRVAVVAANELEYIVVFFAVQRLGAILVPVNYRLTEREITHIISDSQPKLVVYQKEFYHAVKSFDRLEEFEVLVKNSSQSEAVHSEFSAAPNDALMILYTSGTTGSPKGAVLTHSSVFWNSINTSISLNLTQNECAVIFLPLFHTGGWNVLTTPILHRGGKIVLLKKFDSELILKSSSQDKATLLFGVPTTMDMMARHPDFKKIDLTSIRYAIVGGEPMPIELIKTWHEKGIPVRQGYGLTEFGPNVFSLHQDSSMRKIGSIGFANFYVETKVVDENGKSLGANQVGELILKGPMCMKEYWKNSSATSETIRDGWLYTGDLVKFDDEGYYYVVGRRKDMFISGAENVYPAEVEQVLRQIKGVKEAAVIGIPDSKWGEVGKAFLVKEDPALTEESVISHCVQNLAKYKIPKKIVFLDQLPKGDSGKILKKNLPRD
ncbi:MAG: Acyl-CoA synthetase [Pseudobdellovibrio sp.]|nr:Acyl-CoA synthetase [Pseudobdellovibrio sp.]